MLRLLEKAEQCDDKWWMGAIRGILLLALSLIVYLGSYSAIKHSGYLRPFTIKQDCDMAVVAIIYGAVGAFIALLIPIHYTISLDILNKIKENPKKDVRARRFLLCYCHSAEVLVYAFGLFGASVFLEEAMTISSFFGFTVWPTLHVALVIGYALTVLFGVALNWHYWKDWFERGKYRILFSLWDKIARGAHWSPTERYLVWLAVRYSVAIVFSIITVAVWAAFLTVSQCPNLNVVVALVLLTLYYLAWMLLRFLFAPMTHAKMLMIEVNNTEG